LLQSVQHLFADLELNSTWVMLNG